MTAKSQHVVLIGTMAVGKSTIGSALAERLGRPFLDNDALLVEMTGMGPKEMADRSGAEALHDAELDVLSAQVNVQHPSVIATSASVVANEKGRRLIESAGEIVYLRAEPATLVERAESSWSRPVKGDLAASLTALDSERRPFFEELADVVIDVDRQSVEESLHAVLHALQRYVHVELGERSYDVVVGPGARHLLAEVLPTRARRAAIVTQPDIGFDLEPGIESFRFVIEDGEHAKSMSTIEKLCRDFAKAGMTRHDVVIGLGGGVVTDVAGFAAACYHRGVDVVHVATTLLGQVDAAIGGKTGVNIAEGKNLIGAFWQPRAVLCDSDTLATLPERELRAGKGEMAKYAFLGVEELDQLSLVDQVARCVALKAAIVSADEREGDARMLLNYGHTLAHALEAAGFADGPGRDGIDLRHGEAVAIGLVFAARLAKELGRIDEDRVDRHIEVVRGYGLADAVPKGVDPDLLLELMAHDKKATSGLTFILDGPNGVEVVHDIDEAPIRAALALSMQLGEQDGRS